MSGNGGRGGGCRLNRETLRTALARACESATGDYRLFRGEEAYHRACGRVEGILSGAAAVLRSLEGEEVDELLKEVRDLAFRTTGELVRLSGPEG